MSAVSSSPVIDFFANIPVALYDKCLEFKRDYEKVGILQMLANCTRADNLEKVTKVAIDVITIADKVLEHSGEIHKARTPLNEFKEFLQATMALTASLDLVKKIAELFKATITLWKAADTFVRSHHDLLIVQKIKALWAANGTFWNAGVKSAEEAKLGGAISGHFKAVRKFVSSVCTLGGGIGKAFRYATKYLGMPFDLSAELSAALGECPLFAGGHLNPLYIAITRPWDFCYLVGCAWMLITSPMQAVLDLCLLGETREYSPEGLLDIAGNVGKVFLIYGIPNVMEAVEGDEAAELAAEIIIPLVSFGTNCMGLYKATVYK